MYFFRNNILQFTRSWFHNTDKNKVCAHSYVLYIDNLGVCDYIRIVSEYKYLWTQSRRKAHSQNKRALATHISSPIIWKKNTYIHYMRQSYILEYTRM